MLKHLAVSAAVVAAFSAAAAAVPIGFVPDVPTNNPGGGPAVFTAADVIHYGAGLYTPAPVFTIPGNPMVDALEKMDKPGNWLFSVEAHNNLGGALATPADPRDVIRRDSAATYSFFFCGASVGIPDGSNVDAIYLEGGDTGNLVVSFDVPTTIGATTFGPGDLVRFKPTGVPGCAAWALGAPVLAFDASAAGLPASTNVVGADRIGGKIVLAFDVPTTIGAATYLRGTLVSWDGVSFAPFDTLVSWPASSVVDDFAAAANPGRIPPTLHVDKSTITPGDLTLTWTGSCSDGATDYGIYEGTIGSFFSHTAKKCHDSPPALTEEVTPAAGSDYYLVVPMNDAEEGSYGFATSGERPPGATVCQPVQTITPCPP
ncbi:MAG TPA: hypothetical protein VFV19_17490 [Candidatus Polarisedimenticolaceae bacterium]|nr:hypothetical protein [Candidatus Polarisedimenticolaceae bacterium]